MKKALLMLVALLFMGQSALKAQHNCGFEPSPESIDYVTQLLQNAERNNQRTEANVLVNIPLKFHLTRRSDGTGGISQNQVDQILDQLNDYFEPASMRFSQFGDLNYIDNDDLYDFDASREDNVAGSNDERNVVNLYFFNSIRSGGRPLCGYTRFPPSTDRVILAYGCVTGGTTLEHELGHYFTLYHTHGKTNTGTTDELVDGSNCDRAGDDICDTPADPNLSGQVDNCQYVGGRRDANGQPYAPDPSNIMAYAPDQCQNKFTQGQYDRMRQGFEAGRSYLNFSAEGFTATFLADTQEQCIGKTVEFEAISFGASGLLWEFQGGEPATSTEEKPVVRYNSGGIFNVKLTARNSAGEEVVVNRSRFINIIDPIGESVEDSLNASFAAELPEELSLDNPDRGFGFAFSEVDRNGDPNSGSVVLSHYDYFSENLGNLDYLYSPYHNFEGAKGFTVSFDYAYTGRKGGLQGENIIPDRFDSLRFGMESQCGEAGEYLWLQAPSELATAPITDEAFVPATNQWKSVSFFVERGNQDEFARFFFEAESYNGNNLYIDNFSVEPDYSVETPTNFRNSSTEGGAITLRWINPSLHALGVKIERSIDGGAFEEIATVAANQFQYTDNDTAEGEEYTYRVYTYSKFNNRSSYTSEVTVSLRATGLDYYAIKGLSVFPNPSQGQLQLSIDNGEKGEVRAEVYGIDGKLLQSVEGNKLSNRFDHSLDLSNYETGLYFIRISLGEKTTVRKVVLE